MRVAVVGASGLVGASVTELLERQGHDVRRLHRGSVTHPVDLGTGDGLSAALTGVDVVVHAANSSPLRRPGSVMIDGTRRLLAASHAHHVLVSIVGTEAMAPLSRYHRAKRAQEQLVSESGRPFSIVRATQFHEWLGGFALRLARCRLELHHPGRVQPVSARETAAVLAATATADPTESIVTVGGPEVLTITQLRAGRGIRVPAPISARAGAALARGALTVLDPDIRGVLTYSQWLAEARGRPWRPAP